MTDTTMSISLSTLMNLFFFSKDPTGIFRVLKTLFILKGVGYPDSYLGSDVGTSKTNGELTHAFLAHTYIKCEREYREAF